MKSSTVHLLLGIGIWLTALFGFDAPQSPDWRTGLIFLGAYLAGIGMERKSHDQPIRS